VKKYWHGEITKKIKGNSGFGYDPIFYIPNLSCTSAELSASKKSLYSHRGRAMRLLGKMVLEEFNLL
jgi:XTP/dITP diphosphohydrolase